MLVAADVAASARLVVDSVLADADTTPTMWWAHGAGSPLLDRVETLAVLPRVGSLPVTGSKGTIGNAFECSALIDTALVVESLGRGELPPAGLLRRPDPGLGGLDPVMGETRPLSPAPTALVTAFNQGHHSTAAGAIVIASTRGAATGDGKVRT